MSKVSIKSVLSYSVLSAVGIWLFNRTFQGFNFENLLTDLNTAHKQWFVALSISVCSAYLVRAYRWKMLLRASGQNVSMPAALSSLLSGYLVNIIVPRLGEIVRCVGLQKLSKIPVEISIGTVFIERVTDMLMLLMLTLTTVVFFKGILLELLSTQLSNLIIAVEPYKWIGVIFIMILGVSAYLFRSFYAKLSLKIQMKIKGMIEGFSLGISSILKLDNKEKALFLILTVMIWSMYFFHTYALFLIFPRFEMMSATDALLIQTSGSIAKLIPVQANGMGAYHYLVSTVVNQLQLPPETGQTISFFNHGIQLSFTIMLGLIGLISYIVLKIGRK